MERFRVDCSRRQFLAAGIGAGAALAAAGAPAIAVPREEKIRAGFIGIGSRGSRLLETALAEHYAEVAAVCDIDEQALARAAERVEAAGGKKPARCSDHRKLLEDPSIRAVICAVPCAAHHRIYLDCIAAGKHLYGEKPMCLTVKEADEIVAAQEKRPELKVQIGFQRRSDPRHIEGVKLIREDRILGPLLECRAAFNNSWGAKGGHGGPGSWFSKAKESGDWMLEQAVHTWDAINWVAGTTPLRAYGIGHPGVFKEFDPDRDVTDSYCAVIEYPGDLHVQFGHSWISPPDPAFDGTATRFVGPLGGIDLESGKIVWSRRAGRDELVRWIRKDPPPENDTVLSIRSFLDAIRSDLVPRSTVYNGRDATLVGLLVRKAVYERRVVEWSEMMRTC